MENFDKGFTQLPHSIGNILPLINLTGRGYKVIDIVIRLTYGCNRRWAKLKQHDLQIVDIAPNHAKEVLTSLLNNRIIIKNGNKKEYRLNEEYITSTFTQKVENKLAGLRELVGKQLAKETYRNGNNILPEKGSFNLPNREVTTSQNSNKNGLPKREILASEEHNFSTPKDILNKSKYIDKKKDNTYKVGSKTIDPDFFIPRNPTEFEMIETFRRLEGEKKESFPFYLSALKKGLPEDKFREFRENILRTPKVKNKGALFVKKVKEYFENAD